jgi:hypothetical protein
MTRFATQPHWRQRRTAIGKKGFLEAEFLLESEVIVTSTVKQPPLSPASPTSVASLPIDLIVPEMKPLPGAWQVVGKGGRPVKNTNMYDDPAKVKPAKKKRKRARKATCDHDGDAPLATFDEASTSSASIERRASRREKEATAGKEERYWARHRSLKEEKMIAHNILVSYLAAAGALADEPKAAEESGVPPPATKRRASEGKSRREKIRRKARLEARASRCLMLEDEDQEEPSETPPLPRSHAKGAASNGKGGLPAEGPKLADSPLGKSAELLERKVRAQSAKGRKDKVCNVM